MYIYLYMYICIYMYRDRCIPILSVCRSSGISPVRWKANGCASPKAADERSEKSMSITTGSSCTSETFIPVAQLAVRIGLYKIWLYLDAEVLVLPPVFFPQDCFCWLPIYVVILSSTV